MPRVILPSFLVVCVGLVSCATSPEKVSNTAIARAAFDLSCPASSLQATPIGDTTHVGVTPQSPGVERTVVGVTGCEQKAVYVVECVTGACNAILNADTTPAPAPAPSSAPTAP
jgi:hypothetical protein